MASDAKIAVIGDKESIIIFRALGFDTIEAVTGEAVSRAIHQLARDRYAVIYITEDAAETVEGTIETYKTMAYPAIIPIPGRTGGKGIGMKGVRANVEKAIGADIL
ncbi:MAG: V-type ATP synthase subunit F [Eubacteriaceae bacterium]|nr:V-type ATP synthase subunit F [Eubacteriaceae bacterium]